MSKLTGTGVALVTPFTSNFEVDYSGLDKLLKHTATGVDYYVVQGTTGESPTTTTEEKAAILDFVKSNNQADLPIVYGAGGNNTKAVVATVQSTDLNGVTAVLSVSPYYNKPSQAGLLAHYNAIADACPVPIVLYNVPGRTGSNISAETTLALAGHDNIVGIKEASGDLNQCAEIANHKPSDFLLISGDDMQTVAMMEVGAQGVISVLANAYPTIFKDAIQHAISVEFEKGAAVLGILLKMNDLMYLESNPVGVKQLLSELGICSNYVRLPLLPASGELAERILEAIAGVK